MNYRKNTLPLVIASLLVISSCDHNILNVTPTDRLTEAAVWGDSTLVQAYVMNSYLGTRLGDKEGEGNGPGFGRGWEYAFMSSLTDESIYNNDDDTWVIQRGQLDPETLGIMGTIWGRSYNGIRDVNEFLSNIGSVEMSDFNKNRLIAEMRFIRAYRYFDLLRTYGGVPLIGDVVYQLDDDLQSEPKFSRNTIKETIEYIINELEAAKQNLPAGYESGWEEGRATQDAASALMARLLLYAASPLYNDGINDIDKWKAAADMAKEVIGLNEYSLYPDYGELFMTADNNPEIIFQRRYTYEQRHLSLEIAHAPNGYGGWSGNVPLANLVDDYEMNDGSDFDWNDPDHAEEPYTARDPRLYATILFNGADYRGRKVELFTPGGLDSQDGPDNWNTSRTGYNLRKFQNPDLPIHNPWDSPTTQPFIYIRYAEILLNYAEALNEAEGPVVEVYDAINKVRNRAGMPDLSQGLSQDTMRDRIWRERRIELAFEEHRFYDVRRWKIAMETENTPAYGIDIIRNSDGSFDYNQIIALSGRNFEEKHYWMPIPRREIQALDGQLEQNPGY